MEWEALPKRKTRVRGRQADSSKKAKVEEENNAASSDLAISSSTGMAATADGESSSTMEAIPDEIGTHFSFEYLDHTADIQLHTWGGDVVCAFEGLVPCMFGYMTDLSLVHVDPTCSCEFTVTGHDMDSLLFAFLDEFLYRFCTDDVVFKIAKVVEFDRESFRMTVRGHGEKFSLRKHTQGTEVKAITYSNMQILEEEERADIYVIIDI